MDDKSTPIIKIEVDQLKAKIVEHIGADNSELGELIETEIERQVTTFDYAGKVAYEISLQIKTIISEFFKYGEGYNIIKDATVLALSTMFNKNKEDDNVK